MRGLLPVVLTPEPCIDPEVPKLPEVRAVEEMDVRLVHLEEGGVEQGPEEVHPEVVHGDAPTQLVQGGDDNRFLREFRIPFVPAPERDPHPTWLDRPRAHRVPE